jgi:hypothetical protein
MNGDFMSSSYQPSFESQKPQRGFPWGCLLGGCLGIVILGIVLVVGGGIGTYYFAQSQVKKYTAETPRVLPKVERSAEEIEALSERVKVFQEAVEKNGATEELVLTADDINSLISQNEQLKGKVFVKIEDGTVKAEVSFPTDGFPLADGRYFNGSVSGNVSLENGELKVYVDDAEVNNEKIPESFLAPFREQNLAEEMNKDPKVKEQLGKFGRIEVRDDRIILTPKSKSNE